MASAAALVVLSTSSFAAQKGKPVAAGQLDRAAANLQCRKLMAEMFPPSVKTPMYQKRNMFIGCKLNGGRFQGS